MITFHEMEQRSIEWGQIRLGKIGGSQLDKIIDYKTGHLKQDLNKNGSFKSNTPIISAIAGVIAELKTGFSNDSDYVSGAMEWGIEEEENAIGLLENKNTFQCGYVTNSKYKYFGLSPDLLETKKGYEIKCPNSATFVRWKIKMEVPKTHIVQVLAYFVIMDELKEMDFVVYDPRFTDSIFKITLQRADYKEMISNMSSAMIEFDKYVNVNLRRFQ